MSGWDEVEPAPQQVALDESGESTRYTGVSLTLKADGAYDAPWYVIHGQDAEDVLRQLKDEKLKEVLKLTTEISTGWAKHQLSAKGLEPVQQQPRQQRQQQSKPSTQPDEPPPTCEHGEREWRDFKSQKGNHVQGWFCRERGSECKPIYKSKKNN